MVGKEEIRNRFGFHKASIEGPNATGPKHHDLRLAFIDFAEYLDSVLPDQQTPNGRSVKDVAFERLEDASMWSHKAIAETAPIVVE